MLIAITASVTHGGVAFAQNQLGDELRPQPPSSAPTGASVSALMGAPVGPKRSPIGLVCPVQFSPEMPRKALQGDIMGVVKAQIHIKGNVVQSVEIVSGHPVFHDAVRAAMLRYKCFSNEQDVIATQEFSFKISKPVQIEYTRPNPDGQ